ncbi:Protein restricted to Verrucomicrobia-Planctomycetes group [Planctomycetales bacterium 10988]|nr:Protein restricted to Verrucomicrobia-Planctomycetes group [Planctomycetales bacterium 10988]
MSHNIMVSPSHPFAEILMKDHRYAPPAYYFVFEALQYAQEKMGMGSGETEEERHVSGQELCQAIRVYAQEQFGFMAKCVLNRWGVYNTGDFGEIVYNLIQINRMRRTDRDKREDFDDVFDFEKDLKSTYEILEN